MNAATPATVALHAKIVAAHTANLDADGCAGVTMADLATRFGVSVTTVLKVLKVAGIVVKRAKWGMR